MHEQANPNNILEKFYLAIVSSIALQIVHNIY